MAKISKDLDEKIRREAKNRCGYCLNPQELIPYSKSNILYRRLQAANLQKKISGLPAASATLTKPRKPKRLIISQGKTVKLVNPRKQKWREHFDFTEDKTEIIGKTPCGRAPVEALQINNFYQVTARSIWVEMNKYPPKEF